MNIFDLSNPILLISLHCLPKIIVKFISIFGKSVFSSL